MALRVLLFGPTGQVGRELMRADWARGVELIAPDRQAADFRQPEQLETIVRHHRPDVVVVAAAYTNVDRAESDAAEAIVINAEAPAAIAAAASDLGAPIVHFSTDYVFDGRKSEPYSEDDEARPLNAYGRSKLAGEEGVRRANPKHMILRTSAVYAAAGANFFNTMLRQVASSEVRVVDDQVSCPTSGRDLATAVAHLVPRLLTPETRFGVYHLAGATAASRADFAEAIFAHLAKRGLSRPRIVRVRARDYPAAAVRPADSRLSSERIAQAFGTRLRGFERALPDAIDSALAPA